MKKNPKHFIFRALKALILSGYGGSILLIYSTTYHCAIGQEDIKGEERDQVLDPTVSERCRYLLKQRDEILRFKQRTINLIRRSEKILKNTPPHRKTLKIKMANILSGLKQEQKILEFKLLNMSEDIVRKGCPGVVL